MGAASRLPACDGGGYLRVKILVIRNEPPWPLCYGGRLHCYELCRRLAERHHLRMIVERPCESDEWPFNFECRVAGASRLDNHELDLEADENQPGRLERYFGINMGFVREVVRFTRQWQPEIVIGMNYQSLACLAHLKQVPTICDLQDDEVLHRWRELWHGRATSKWNDLKCLLAVGLFQRKYIRKVDAVTVLSDVDQRVCRLVTGHRRIECIPHGVDCEHYTPSDQPVDENRAIFWGGLTFGPNLSAILYFVEKVWPVVLAKKPQMRFSIMGRGHSPLLDRLKYIPGIDLIGYVDDIRPHVADAALVVVPMISGGGIKNKIMEAWAMGKAVLCTPRALGNLPGIHRQNVWIAKSPRALAEGLVTLTDDKELRDALGRAGRQTALEHCSWDRAAEQLERLCKDVLLAKNPVRFDVDLASSQVKNESKSNEVSLK